MEKGVLTVFDNEHMWLTLWEAMKSWVRNCRISETCGKSRPGKFPRHKSG